MRLSVILTWVLALSFFAGLALWILSLSGAGRTLYGEMMIGISFLIAGHVFMALPCARTWERGRTRVLMIAGMAICAASAASWTSAIWIYSTQWQSPPQSWLQFNGVLTTLSAWCMIVALAMTYRLTMPVAIVARALTIIAASITALIVMEWIVSTHPTRQSGELHGRAVAVFSIITIASLLLTMVFSRIRQLTTGADQEHVELLDFSVWCPRCDLHQPIRTGGAKCSQCGLEIRVVIP